MPARIYLDRLFDDGSGRVKPELVSFVEALGAMDSPRVGLNWPYKAATVEPPRWRWPGSVSSPSWLSGTTLAMSNGRE
jgi:hypothetical protein